MRKTPELLESILADEITHVRFANQWLRVLLREDRRLALKIAMAVRFLSGVTAALAPQEGQLSPIGLPYEEPKTELPRSTLPIADEAISRTVKSTNTCVSQVFNRL